MTLPALACVESGPPELVDGVPVLARGHVLGRSYIVLELLSRGDALDVYSVWSTERACVCVAKTLRPDLGTGDRRGERVRRRLLQEGRLLLSLSHPHLVRAYEVVEADEPVVVLETLVGETLGQLLERRARRLPVMELAFLGLHMCSALGYLHRSGYLHLDIKPDNVIACGGLAKVIDLSLAQPPGRAARGLGTRGYLAPEQATGDELTAATDVWGLGVTLYEAATDVRPFARHSELGDDTSRQGRDRYPQLSRRPVPVRALRRTLPRPFAELVDSCLALEPERRPTLAAAAAVFARLVPDPAAEMLAGQGDRGQLYECSAAGYVPERTSSA